MNVSKTTFSIIVLGFLLLLMQSCETKPCEGFACINGNAQPDGKDCFCICDLGWSGDDCTIEDRCITNNITCSGNGSCDHLTTECDCLTGYEGRFCETASRDKFLDNGLPSSWTAIESCNGTVMIYNLTIENNFENELTIFNIQNLSVSDDVPVRMTGEISFSQEIGFKEIGPNGSEIGALRGTLLDSGDTITISYNLFIPAFGNKTCNGTWIRQ